MGIRTRISRSTLAEANEKRDWRIYADFAQSLIQIARRLYLNDSFGVDLDNTVYALDSTTIDLCLSVFPWANFRRAKAAIKLHTLLDLRGSIPTFIHVSPGKLHDVNLLDTLLPEAARILHHGPRLSRFRAPAFIHTSIGLLCDPSQIQSQVSSPVLASNRQVDWSALRPNRGTNRLLFLSALSGQTSSDQISRSGNGQDVDISNQQFFIASNHHYRVVQMPLAGRTVFQMDQATSSNQVIFGTSENAVKTQIWIAVSVYVLVAIIKKRHQCEASLYTILQILSLTLFERTSLNQLLTNCEADMNNTISSNQLNLFD